MKDRFAQAKTTVVCILAMLIVIYWAAVETMAASVTKKNSLLDMQYQTMTDEALDDALMKASDYEVGQFLYSLTERERRELLGRNTVLNVESICNTYRYQKGVDEPIHFKPYKQEKMPYYEIAMNTYLDQVENQSTYIVNEGVYASKTSGSYRMNLYRGEKLLWKSNIVLSGVDTTKDLSEQQMICVKENITGLMIGGSVTTHFGVEGQASLSLSRNRTDGQYRSLIIPLKFKKEQGYYVELQKDNYSNKGDFTILNENGEVWSKERRSEEMITSELTSCVDILYNTTLGDSTVNNEYGKEAVFNFYYKPAEYVVDYDGNGATSGATLSQSCDTMSDAYYQPNGFQRKYRVNFDGNGGESSDAHKDCQYIFVGWGEKAADNEENEIHKEGERYYRLTTKKDEHITRYALWENDSITLPIAVRDGYRFVGWSKDENGEEPVLNAYSQYIPKKNETMYAVWEKENATVIDKTEQEVNEPDHIVSGNEITPEEKPADTTQTNQPFVERKLSGEQTIRSNNLTIVCDIKNQNEVVIKEMQVAENLRTLIIPNEMTIGNQLYKVTRIEGNCIKGGKKLRTIQFDCANLVSIGKNAFSGLTKLKTVGLSKATKLQYIPDNCFSGCKSLTSIVIPKSVKKIGRKAFYSCKQLKKVTIKSTKLNYVGSKAFVKCNKKLKFVVPNAKKKQYKKLLRIS